MKTFTLLVLWSIYIIGLPLVADRVAGDDPRARKAYGIGSIYTLVSYWVITTVLFAL